MRGFKSIVAALVMMLSAASTADAALYQIQVGGINITYSQATGLLCDGVNGNCAGADPLLDMSFIVDGTEVGELESPATSLSFDMLLFLVPGTDPTVLSLQPVLNSGLDIFDFQINGAPGLYTDVTSGSVAFTNGSLSATGSGNSLLFAQNLPFGFSATNPINWSFSASNTPTACTGAPGSLVCNWAGTGEIQWVSSVPDGGSTLALLGLGLVGLRQARRRFWNR